MQVNYREHSADDGTATERQDSVTQSRQSRIFPRAPRGLADPCRARTESIPGIGKEATDGLSAGLRCAGFWRVPPNWSTLDWGDELYLVGLAAAWQAEREHDPSCGVPVGGFVFVRVKARALTRYRQEWQYALHVASAATEMIETFAGADMTGHPAGAAFEALDWAIGLLPEMERWLLNQLFWQHRTEVGIAAELHISQPAVNKRKRLALLHLRALL